MKKEKSLAELFTQLEKEAEELKKKNTFKGNNADLACVLAAGLKIMAEK